MKSVTSLGLVTVALCSIQLFANSARAQVSLANSKTLICQVSTTSLITEASGLEDIGTAETIRLQKTIKTPESGGRKMAKIEYDTKDGVFHIAIQVTDDDTSDQYVSFITNKQSQIYTVNTAASSLDSQFMIPLKNPDPNKFPDGKLYQGAGIPAATGVDVFCSVR